MASLRNPGCFRMMLSLNFALVHFCSDMPYWQSIQTPVLIDFSVTKIAVSESQEPINKPVSINLIDIGVVYTCLDKSYCFPNEQLREVLLLPSAQASLAIYCGVIAANLAFSFSIILAYVTHNCIFYLLNCLLWASFILLFIGFIDVHRVLVFNNWAPWGFFIGTIFMFVLAVEVIYIWKKYNKDTKCHETHDLPAKIV